MVAACGAKKRVADEVRLFGGVRRSRRALMMTTALQAAALLVLAVPGYAQPAPNARPMGAQVVVGQASIAASANATAITQGSQRAAINWTSFDVGSQHSVTFAQPSSSAIALNRVIGPDPSQIAGKITANGQVALVNQSGVVFYKGSQVNVSTLIVSAAGITDKNFAAGKMVFDQPARPNARIENHGDITVKETGLAALVAPQVANSGTITAKLGHVVLAGATTHTVDLYGDGLLSIDVTGQVKQAPVGPDGKKATALVTNTGVIAADGGTITLTAQAADGIVQNLVSAGGKLRANSVGDKAGTIQVAGIGGSVTIEGAVSAEGGVSGTRGGQIELVSTDTVRVASGARLDASGKSGGGTVAVGTTLARARGGAAVKGARTAKSAIVESRATIRADASGRGDGGRIVLLSTESTDQAGTITARGGARGGDGGLVEASGDRGFALTGNVDVSAPAGRPGTILLDPTNLDIVATSPAGTNINSEFAGNSLPGTAPDAGTLPSTITAGKLAALVAAGDVVVQATRQLAVQTSVSVTRGLTLQAGRDLLVDRGITIATGGTLNLTSGMVFAGDPQSGTGSILIGTTGSGGPTTLSAPAIVLQAGPPSSGKPGIDLTDTAIDHGTGVATAKLDISAAGGGVTQASGGAILATTLQSAAGVTGSVNLGGGGNQIATAGTLTVAGGDFALNNSGPLGITGSLAANNVSIGNTGTITVSGSLVATATASLNSTGGGIDLAGTVQATGAPGHLTLIAGNGGVTEQPGGTVATKLLSGSATGTVTLDDISGGGNQVANLGPFSAGGITLIDQPSVTVAGDLTASGTLALTSGGAITQNAGTLIAATGPAGTVSLTAGAGIAFGGTIRTVAAASGGTGSVTLTAQGDIAENVAGNDTGLVRTPLLTGAATGTVTLDDISGGGNQVANLGPFSAGGNFTLIDQPSVTVAGDLTASGALALTSGGAITQNAGTLIAATGPAGTVSLTAGAGIAFGGTIRTVAAASGGTGSVTLTAQGGDITETVAGNDTGLLRTPLLTGAATGSVTLDDISGGGNQAANLGLFAAGGNFTLIEAISLGVTGAVQVGNGRKLALTAPSIALVGGSLTADAVISGGAVTPGIVALRADAISLTEGAVFAPDGMVTISRLNPGILSLDPSTVGGNLSLTQADLDNIHTLGITTGPLGTQTLVLGSLNGLTPDPNTAQFQINGQVYGFGQIARTLALLSTGDITETATGAPGGVGVTALTGAAPNGNIDLSGPNQIAQTGNFVAVGNYSNDGPPQVNALRASGDLLLVNTQDLTVGTAVAAGANAEIDLVGGSLTVAGNVAAGNVFLRAGNGTTRGSVTVNGSVTAGGESDLVAGMTYTPGTFHPAPLFTPGVGAPGSGGAIAINGSVDAGTVGLYSANDTAETGIIAAGLLKGQAGVPPNGSGLAETLGNVSLAGATPTGNRIAALGSYLTTGSFLLSDGQALTVVGAVNSGTASTATPGIQPRPYGATINVPGNALTVNGSVTAGVPLTGAPALPGGDVALNAGSITLAGAAGAPRTSGAIIAAAGANGGGTVGLTAESTILEDALGYLQAVMLTGSSGNVAGTGAGSALFNGGAAGSPNANTVASLGSFTTNVNTAVGNFMLLDGRSLTVTGAVTANKGSATINAHAGPGAAGNPTAGDLIVNASVHGDVDANLSADGTITDNGGVSAGRNANLTAGAGIANNALVASGAASTLTASGGNIIDQGGVSAGTTASLTATGAITQNAGIITSGGDAILTARTGGITISGQGVHGGADATLTAGTTIVTNGPIVAGTNAGLVAGTDIADNGGITAAAGNAGLTAGGSIFNNAPVTSGLASTLLAAGGTITDQGGVTAGTTASLTAGGSIAQNAATITAAGSGVTLTAQGGGVTQAAGATISATNGTGTVALNAAQGIAIGGTLVAIGGGAGVTLAARNGDVTETDAGARTGLIDATFLTGSAGGDVTLDNSAGAGNQIGTLGAFAARGGTFNMADARALLVAGPVSAATSAAITDPATVAIAPGGSVTAPAVSLTAADLAIQGSVEGANTVRLVATSGGIAEPGALTAGTLAASSSGIVSLPGATPLANRVATLGNVTAGNFTLVDGEDLLIAGTLNAPSIHIDDSGFALAIGNGTAINTGGVARPLGKVAFTTLPTYAQGAPGAYLRAGSFQQVGNVTVAPLNGGPTSLRIDVTSPTGNVMFGANGGLTANTTDLVVDLTGGTLGGLIFVKTLDLRYVPGAGNANLSGTVNGLGGPAAAGVSYITPLPNPKYQINRCPISSVNCILLSVAAVPVINPLQDIYLGVLGNAQDDDDLLLPDVSERDY